MQSYFVSVFLLLQKLWTDNATRSQRVTGTASHATRHCGNLTRYWKVVVVRAHFSRKNCSQLGLRRGDKYFKKDVQCLKYWHCFPRTHEKCYNNTQKLRRDLPRKILFSLVAAWVQVQVFINFYQVGFPPWLRTRASQDDGGQILEQG